MSISSRMHYFVSCDIDGCEELFDAGFETDNVIARIATYQSGWGLRQHAAVRGPKRRFDICAKCVATEATGVIS